MLIGTGAAAFTLISAHGFTTILNTEPSHDPARIAAQIVSGVGFIGAGVIFTRRNSVRGLTTAATIWVAAAVGMAAGSGMISLAIGLTAMYLFALLAMGPLVAKMPTRDTNRIVRITYNDGEGVLRDLLSTATDEGFSAFILSTRRFDDSDLVELDARFKGKAPLQGLMSTLHHMEGVREVHLVRSEDDDDEEDDS